ncbi:MAG: hypothetical protein LBR64_02105 [Dysgonamonadaceae bacterium]|jgi:hypothetical protein|nr:hypothetical protein [Dysgonamonadaceae bacterium]
MNEINCRGVKTLRTILALVAFIFIGAAYADAQVKIGDDSAPRDGAALDLNSSKKGGLVLSNVQLTSLDEIPASFVRISAPLTDEEKTALKGALVWNSNEVDNADPAKKIYIGLYLWNGEQWIRLKCKSN